MFYKLIKTRIKTILIRDYKKELLREEQEDRLEERMLRTLLHLNLVSLAQIIQIFM